MAEGIRLDGCFDRIHPSAYFDSVGCVANTSAVVAIDVAVAVADTSVVAAAAYTTARAAAAVDSLAEEVQLVQH